MVMMKIVAVWSGWAGGPGYSSFYTGASGDGAQLTTAANKVKNFFAGITLAIPTGITISIQPTALSVNEGDGSINDEVPITTVPANVVGAGSANFSAPSGACVIWRTGGFVGGRRLRGKTFLVPLSGGVYDTDGTIIANRLTELRSVATTFATPGGAAATDFVVWHRPVAGAGGSSSPIISASVADRAAILSSRRS